MNNQLPTRIGAIEHFTTRLVSGAPALLIDPSCKTLIRALTTGWRYKLKKDDERAPEPEKNSFSHPADGFGYLCKYCANQSPAYADPNKRRRAVVADRPRPYHVR